MEALQTLPIRRRQPRPPRPEDPIARIGAIWSAFFLGRMFRQQLAGLGVDITKVKLTIGSVIDNSLREIAAQGFASG